MQNCTPRKDAGLFRNCCCIGHICVVLLYSFFPGCRQLRLCYGPGSRKRSSLLEGLEDPRHSSRRPGFDCYFLNPAMLYILLLSCKLRTGPNPICLSCFCRWALLPPANLQAKFVGVLTSLGLHGNPILSNLHDDPTLTVRKWY